MQRTTSTVILKTLAAVVLSLSLLLVAPAAFCNSNLQSVLDGHSPTTDSGSSAASTSTGTGTSGSGQSGVQAQIDKVIAEIKATLEKIAKVVGDIAKAQEAETGGTSYTVVSGDCLWTIAQRFLGDGARYTELVEANKDKYPSLEKNPNLIYPGWTLKIPGAKTSVAEDTGSNTDSGAGSAVAQKVAQVAAGFVSKYNGYQKFPYAAGTEGGNLGCANVVSQALKDAGVNAWSLNCDGVKNALLGLKSPNNWKVTSAPPYQPGDVVIWKAPPGGAHKHIGIVVKNGNSFSAMNNSSSQRKPILSTPVNYRAVECVVRKV